MPAMGRRFLWAPTIAAAADHSAFPPLTVLSSAQQTVFMSSCAF